MKQISLTQGMYAIVDDADFEWLNQWKWHIQAGHNTYYAVRKCNGKRIRMHRLILGCTENEEVDHKNHNGLDNQRHNIRKCTHSQNMQNLPYRKGGSSKYKGVSWDKESRKWLASIKLNGIKQRIGLYLLDIDAAKAYDKVAIKLFGDFACPNLR